MSNEIQAIANANGFEVDESFDDLAIIAAFQERDVLNSTELFVTAATEEVTALFGHKGAGRKFAGVVAAVLGILSILSISVGGPLGLAVAVYGLAWYIGGVSLFRWGKLSEEKAKILHEARDTKSPEGKKRLAKKMKHIQDAEKAVALIRKSKPWKNPKVAAKLAKKDPAQVRQVLKILQSA